MSLPSQEQGNDILGGKAWWETVPSSFQARVPALNHQDGPSTEMIPWILQPSVFVQ